MRPTPETREATIIKVGSKTKPGQKPGSAWAWLMTDNGYWKGTIGENLTPGTWIRAIGVVEPKSAMFPEAFHVSKVLELVREKEDVGGAWLKWRLEEIGDARAKALSDKFGDRLPDVMDNSDKAKAELTALRGLTPDRIQKVLRSYSMYPDELRLVIWLGEIGFPWSALKAIVEHYKNPDEINDMLNEDPYTPMEIEGIKFRTCDVVAHSLGLEKNDPRRVRAIVLDKLVTAAKQKGETVIPIEEVFQELHTFGYSPKQLMTLLNEGEHFEVGRVGAQLLRYRDAETTIANRVLSWESNKQTKLDLSNVQSRFPHLDPSQQEAVTKLLAVPVAILTGGPGTGKTTVLKTALTLIEEGGERIKLASPTGKAAKRMTEATGRPASTVHKLLEWRPEGFKRNKANPIDADVVVIDESSMLDTELAGSLFAALSKRTRLILVGDVNQLPPVSTGQVLLDLMFSGVVPVYRLTKTHRQAKDSWVIDNASRILEGKLPSLTAQSDFKFVKMKDSEAIIQSVVTVYQHAREKGYEKQLQVLTPEHEKGAGTKAINAAVQEALNPNASAGRFNDQQVMAGGYKIFPGDKVIYTDNNAQLGLVNGSMGIVEKVSVTGNSAVVYVRFEGDVNPETGDDMFELRDSDIHPLLLAYAMTVHKAQGSEWQNVVVIADPQHWSMRRKLLYTAVTRTSKNLWIIGSESAVARGAQNNPDENRATLLQPRLRGEEV